MKRVVVTGMGGLSPIGSDWHTIEQNLRVGATGIRFMNDWRKYTELNTRLGAPIEGFDRPAHYPRKMVRSMGRVALMSTRASELALQDAGLLDDPCIKDGRMGVSYGSSTGSPEAILDFGNMLLNHASAGINANSYLKMMSHT
ncbi:MAG: beta-ketoacyl synthase N-terminal-like domain-containing protein, partial [Haliea sp.]